VYIASEFNNSALLGKPPCLIEKAVLLFFYSFYTVVESAAESTAPPAGQIVAVAE